MAIEKNSAAKWDQSYTSVDRTPLKVVEGIPPQDRPAAQAYAILWVAFALAPIVAGLDKFFEFLTDWTQYLAPAVPRLTGLAPSTFMSIVGVIEIIAGIGVIVKPKIFGYVVAAWMGGIIVNLLVQGRYFDVALRDFGLALAAIALSRLATTMEWRERAHR